MAGATAQDVLDLVKRVKATGKFEVADLGPRFRITNPHGGAPVFISRRPPKGNTLKASEDALAAIGFNDFVAQEEQDRRRQERIDADRKRNEEKLMLAQRSADERAQEIKNAAARRAQEIQDAATAAQRVRDERPARAAALASRAPVVLGGYRKDYVEVDLTFAEDLLRCHNVAWKTNGGTDEETNRRMDARTIAEYAASMARGKWGHHHQGLALDNLGRFADGQQRCAALVLANQPGFLRSLGLDEALAGSITFWTEITYDVDPAATTTMDQGRRRSKATILGMKGIPNGLHVETALKLVYLYDSVPYERVAWYRYQMPVDLMWETLAANPAVEQTVSRATRNGRWTVISSLGCLIHLVERDAAGLYDEPMATFLDGMRTGLNFTTEGDPRAAIRSLREKRNKHRRVHSVETLAILIKAWNAHLTRRTFGKGGLRFRADVEPFPRVIRPDDPA